MSAGSSIEWTDHTFNPWWGCARVSPGCNHCYAESFAKRYGHDVWGKGGDRRFFGDKHWSEPLKWNAAAEKAGVRAKVFTASMADVFEEHPALPPQRERLWTLIERTPWLAWQLLTKRTENVLLMVPTTWLEPGGWPAHAWIGATVEDQVRARTRVGHLRRLPAPVRFLSCEPMVGPVAPDLEGIQWVICGGESGPGARPMDPQWARSLRDQCAAAGVPFLFKQWGQHDEHGVRRASKHDAGRLLDGRTHDEFPRGCGGDG